MDSAVAPSRFRFSKGPQRVERTFKQLGIACKKGAFWRANEADLPYLFHDFKVAAKLRKKELAEGVVNSLNGHHSSDFANFIESCTFVERAFARRGIGSEKAVKHEMDRILHRRTSVRGKPATVLSEAAKAKLKREEYLKKKARQARVRRLNMSLEKKQAIARRNYAAAKASGKVEADKDNQRARAKKWQRRHRLSCNKKSREYRASHPAKVSLWRKTYKAKCRARGLNVDAYIPGEERGAARTIPGTPAYKRRQKWRNARGKKLRAKARDGIKASTTQRKGTTNAKSTSANGRDPADDAHCK